MATKEEISSAMLDAWEKDPHNGFTVESAKSSTPEEMKKAQADAVAEAVIVGGGGGSGSPGTTTPRWVKDAFPSPGAGPWTLSKNPVAGSLTLALQGQLWEEGIEYTILGKIITKLAGAPALTGATRRLVARYQTTDP